MSAPWCGYSASHCASIASVLRNPNHTMARASPARSSCWFARAEGSRFDLENFWEESTGGMEGGKHEEEDDSCVGVRKRNPG